MQTEPIDKPSLKLKELSIIIIWAVIWITGVVIVEYYWDIATGYKIVLYVVLALLIPSSNRLFRKGKASENGNSRSPRSGSE